MKLDITEVHLKNEIKLECKLEAPTNMTASKFHRILKKLGGEIQGRLVFFKNQDVAYLEDKITKALS